MRHKICKKGKNEEHFKFACHILRFIKLHIEIWGDIFSAYSINCDLKSILKNAKIRSSLKSVDTYTLCDQCKELEEEILNI